VVRRRRSRSLARASSTRIAPRVALPPSFGRAHRSSEVAEEVEQDVLVRLLDRERRLLHGVDDPLAFAATVARNLARDALRRHRRRGDLGDDREQVDDGRTPALDGADPATHLDAQRAIALLENLGEDARLAVYLTHAPARMPNADWALLCSRRGEPPSRPEGPLDRDEASALLWPPPVPETRPARRLRLERIRKVLSRAYEQLAAALGAE
jgi:hypothetical protein